MQHVRVRVGQSLSTLALRYNTTVEAIMAANPTIADRNTIHVGDRLDIPGKDDPVAHVRRSLARVPWPWEVEVLLALPPERAAERLPATLAELEPEGDGTLLRMRVSSLDWTAGVLAGLGCGFTIRRPDELRVSVDALASRLSASAKRDSPISNSA